MGKFKDFILLILYLYCLINIISGVNSIVFISMTVISLIFVFKYFQMKKRVNLSNAVLKQYLVNQRNTFVNALNHDLRVPIIAQLRIMELLNKYLQNHLNDFHKELLNQAELSCKSIFNLVSLLINAYNTENGNKKSIFKSFDVIKIISDCICELKNEANEKNIGFYCENLNDVCCIFADKDDVKNIIRNILLSTVINSEYGSVIYTKVEQIQDSVRITVTGKNEINYSKANMDFAAIGQSTRMYFCKKVLELNKGRMIFNCSIPNSFIFELPKRCGCVA